jgi:diguanylate cyclase (GGDEF)-like protein
MLILMADRSPAGSLPEVHQRLAEAMDWAERHGARLAVLCLELDPKSGADRDAVRAQVSLRLAGTLRASDDVLGAGVDRLVVLLPGVESVGDAATVARKVLDVLEEPVAVEGRMLRVEGRVGLTLYPDHGFDADALLRNAEEAMRRAATQGDVRWHAPRSTLAASDDVAG